MYTTSVHLRFWNRPSSWLLAFLLYSSWDIHTLDLASGICFSLFIAISCFCLFAKMAALGSLPLLSGLSVGRFGCLVILMEISI